MDFSVVIPMMNEEKNVPRIYAALCAEFEKIGPSFELIFVDDGSTDRSALEVERLIQSDPRVRLLCFSRNFGHQAALTAGLEAASGRAVITMDADLQHPPAIVPKLIEKWRAGYQIVIAVRESTEGISWHKKLTSGLFYKFFSLLANVNLTANAADFRLLDREVVKVLCGLRERVRFLRGLTGWVGFNAIEVPYVAAKREHGETKYSIRKMISLALGGITSFSSKPLYLAAYAGMMVTFIGCFYAAYIFYVHFFTVQTVPGWTSVILLILFMGGLQLLSSGLLGIYLGKAYDEVKGRPIYILAKKSGFEQK
ncbi:MAG: glycosyltransferase family 2 protein [Bacteriovoracia bacterium]